MWEADFTALSATEQIQKFPHKQFPHVIQLELYRNGAAWKKYLLQGHLVWDTCGTQREVKAGQQKAKGEHHFAHAQECRWREGCRLQARIEKENWVTTGEDPAKWAELIKCETIAVKFW